MSFCSSDDSVFFYNRVTGLFVTADFAVVGGQKGLNIVQPFSATLSKDLNFSSLFDYPNKQTPEF